MGERNFGIPLAMGKKREEIREIGVHFSLALPNETILIDPYVLQRYDSCYIYAIIPRDYRMKQVAMIPDSPRVLCAFLYFS